ncbi:hypothetical protein PMAYCL1PPCAC_07951, partial [Pristionchus mayeri]
QCVLPIVLGLCLHTLKQFLSELSHARGRPHSHDVIPVSVEEDVQSIHARSSNLGAFSAHEQLEEMLQLHIHSHR